MPQTAIAASVAKNTSNALAPLTLDSKGNLLVSSNAGYQSTLAVNAATLVKGTPGRIVRVSVTTAGTAVGAVNDSATLAGAAAANLIAAIPNVVGVYAIDFPAQSGIVITPGTGQVVSVSYQ